MRRGRRLGDILKSKKMKSLEEAETLEKLRDKTYVEKGDIFALIVAGLTTIVPVVVVILLLYYFITMFVFG